jgi:hypothetical protein
MTIIEIPQRRLINTDSYHQSRDIALDLQEKESRPIESRRRMIVDLLELVHFGDENDFPANDQAIGLTSDLLRSDPLTDQQAGAVARCLRAIRSLDLWPLEETNRHFYLDPGEMVEIMAGDWEQINQIFNRYPQRAVHWQTSLHKINNSPTPKTVYRMLELHPDDLPSIRQFGLVPGGLHHYADLSHLIAAHQKQYFGQGNVPHHAGIESLADKLFLSKANLLSAPSPFKLGQAAFTSRNIRHRGFAYLGNYIFELAIPANRLVANPKNGLTEDEQTILFYIPPEAIKAVHEIEPISNFTTWEQLQIIRYQPRPKDWLKKLFGQ